MIHSDFLLQNQTAQDLYHEYAEDLPIIDFHNHLPIRSISDDQRSANWTEIWIANDPYKHRAMRIAGVPEDLITGNAPAKEKFLAWIRTIPMLLGNPLDHWTRLELLRIFDFSDVPDPDHAEEIWNRPILSTREILKRFPIEYSAPCAAPGEDLTPFSQCDDLPFVPSLRDNGAAKNQILDAIDLFHRAGCRFADHALDADWHFRDDDPLIELGGEYNKRNWTLQIHLGALRKTSSRLRSLAGPAGGYAAIGNSIDLSGLARLLDAMEKSPNGLPKIILYNLNPADNAALATLTGSFSEDGIRGKIQFGPAWWYNDHRIGIRNHLDCIASYGLLSAFIGMTTDSRSPLSFVRHEYFRRVLCGWFGEKVEQGIFPDDLPTLGSIIQNIVYNNIKEKI
ncbi:MAG: glucuronate isomerase [Planctomycetia bacterium]|nr:glucuronate isomerase [Planctomycetia bacterium]